MNLVVAGGGTGGHIFAGVAIAQEFTSQSKANKVLFVGSQYGLEVKLVPKWGFELVTLRLGKLVGQSVFRKLLTLIEIPIAVIKCIATLKKFKAELVVGVGGYAAGPCIVAARILNIPVGVLEQNAVMGFTNRISAKLSNHVFTAFNEVPLGVPASKCIFTGNPSRGALKPITARNVKPFTIFVFGGSQGALGINRMMIEAVQELKKLGSAIAVIHQTGERDYEWVKKAYLEMNYSAEVHKFIDDMQGMYNRASLVVCRAGSGTIAELGATKSAAILIPFPAAAGNHQVFNAQQVNRCGAGETILQIRDGIEVPGSELAAKIKVLMNDPDRLEAMREAVTQFHKPDAAKRIVDTMKVHALRSHV